MVPLIRQPSSLIRLLNILVSFFIVLSLASKVMGQEKSQYIRGQDNQLKFVVYVIGEVKKPGEYIVSDGTDLAEMLSIAGGPTEFSNLGSVLITRNRASLLANSNTKELNGNVPQRVVIKFDVNKYLRTRDGSPAPHLEPGDIISVHKNKWYRWKSGAKIIRDVSVIATAYFLYLRATR